jgi:hypothetical protein
MEGSEVTPLAERFNQVDNARTTTTGPARIRERLRKQTYDDC